MDRFGPLGGIISSSRPPMGQAYNDAVFEVKKGIWTELEDDMFCAECGAKLGSLDQACSTCGTKVEQDNPVPLPVAVPEYRKSGFGVWASPGQCSEHCRKAESFGAQL
jgi:hypothetical protein